MLGFSRLRIFRPNATDPLVRVRRIRTAAFVMAGLILSVFVASGFWFIEMQLGGGYIVQANVGTVRVAVIRPEMRYEENSTPDLTFSEGFEGLIGAAAWRPFHADNGYSNAIVVPLWQPLLGLIAVAAYCQGYLRGRRHDPAHCRACGYLLHGLPIVDSRRTCPECGRSNYIGEDIGAPRRPPEISRAA